VSLEKCITSRYNWWASLSLSPRTCVHTYLDSRCVHSELDRPSHHRPPHVLCYLITDHLITDLSSSLCTHLLSSYHTHLMTSCALQDSTCTSVDVTSFTRDKCRYHVDIMSISCRYHVDIMSLSCRYHVVYLTPHLSRSRRLISHHTCLAQSTPCLYLYICVYAYMYMNICIYIHVYTYTNIRICISVYIYVNTFIYIYTDVYIYIYVYIYINAYVYTYI